MPLVILTDFDGDDMINKEDLKKVIKRLTGIQILEPTDMQQLINNVRAKLSIHLLSDRLKRIVYAPQWFLVFAEVCRENGGRFNVEF